VHNICRQQGGKQLKRAAFVAIMIVFAHNLNHERRRRSCPFPWIFTHDTANVFFNKHTFRENISTPTSKEFFAALLDVETQGCLRPSGDLGTSSFAWRCSEIFWKARHFSWNGCLSKMHSLFTQGSWCSISL